MTISEFIESLGISVEDNDFQIEHNAYVLRLANSEEFSDIFSLLMKNNDLESDGENTKMEDDYSKITYEYDRLTVILEADYNKDEYTLTVKENNNEK